MTQGRKRRTRAPAALVLIELPTADAVTRHHKEHLSHGGAFGPPGGKDSAIVSILLAGPAGVPLELPARTVYCGAAGTGYELIGFGAEMKQQLEAWVARNVAPDALDQAPTTRILTLRRLPATRPATRTAAAPGPAAKAGEPPGPDEADDDAAQVPRNVFERLRGLPIAQQLKLAREGELNERVALERMAGKAVWEGLLHNPRITPREVARIARMATLPTPLLESIVGNQAWLRTAEVRRALLSNPRLAGELIARVLNTLPKHELRLVPLQTAYAPAVRDAARRLLPKV